MKYTRLNGKVLPAAAFGMSLCLLAGCQGASSSVHTEVVTETTETEAVKETAEVIDYNEAAEGSIAMLRKEIRAAGAVCGVSFVGYAGDIETGNYDEWLIDTGYGAAYPFIAMIPDTQIIANSGDEVYCIVPVEENSKVVVSALGEPKEDGTQPVGETLYEDTDGVPILVRGNVSDIMPNVQITVTESAGASISFSPSISLKDGSLVTADNVYDFTLSQSDTEENLAVDIVGDWTYTQAVENDQTMYYHLEFNDGGAARFYYFKEQASYEAEYQGTYSCTDYKDGVYTVTVFLYNETDAFWTTIGVTSDGTGQMAINYLEGTPLLDEMQENTLIFVKTVG